MTMVTIIEFGSTSRLMMQRTVPNWQILVFIYHGGFLVHPKVEEVKSALLDSKNCKAHRKVSYQHTQKKKCHQCNL
jgi:hypothetical protein